MPIALNINNLLDKQKIESNRIEFKKGWNPISIYHSVCAFANDFDDLGGGYIIVGVDTNPLTGIAARPVTGIPLEKIDGILQEMVGLNNKISPYYMPRTSVEEVDGKQLIVIWCPAGLSRPYSVSINITSKTSRCSFYIRSGTSSIEAHDDTLLQLKEMAVRIPFDETGNSKIQLHDISSILLRDFLVNVGSRLANDIYSHPMADILEQMDLYTGPKDNRQLRNVAAMMFCENPDKFFPYTQIDIVTFPRGKINDPANFSEVTFKGSVPQMIKQTMNYIKSSVLREYVRKVPDRQEVERFWNFPYDAVEEAVVNSCYHRDFTQHEPIEITIEPHCITILNCPGPDRSIPIDDIKKGDLLRSRRYRNRRLGDFLKELDLTEGRSTGIPTIQTKLASNGSPRATFETTDERLTFLVTIPIHNDCLIGSETNQQKFGNNQPKSSEINQQKFGNNQPNDSVINQQKNSINPLTTAQDPKLKTSDSILSAIRQCPTTSAAEIAMKLGISTRAVEKHIRKLREAGLLRRDGANNGGSWIITPNP